MKNSAHVVLVLGAAMLAACAAPHAPYDTMRVAVLNISIQDAMKTGPLGEEKPVVEEKGVRAVMEEGLIHNSITVVDDAEVATIKQRLDQAKESGIHTTATDIREYQPAATHGIMLDVKDNFSILALLTLGLYPVSSDATARLIDLRTGEVRASIQATAYGILWAAGDPGMAYRAVRKLSGRIAETLNKIQRSDRHQRPQDWPSNYQQDDSNPSAQGRYTHAIYLAMTGGDDEQALDSLEEAVRMDKAFAEKARHAREFNSLREDKRFKSITQVAGTR